MDSRKKAPTPHQTDPGKPLPNARHEKFAQLVVSGSPARDAYVGAGFKTTNDASTRTAGARMLRDVHIAARVEFLKSLGAAKAVEAYSLTKDDVLRMTLEQHERNIGARPVTHKLIQKSGKQAGKVIEKTVTAYDPKAASQTLKLLHEEFGLGVGGSANRGDDGADMAVRQGRADPKVAADLDNLRTVRGLVLATKNGKPVGKVVDGAEALAVITGRKA